MSELVNVQIRLLVQMDSLTLVPNKTDNCYLGQNILQNIETTNFKIFDSGVVIVKRKKCSHGIIIDV